jgi:hypothetical protein
MTSEANSHSELDGLGEVEVAIKFGGFVEYFRLTGSTPGLRRQALASGLAVMSYSFMKCAQQRPRGTRDMHIVASRRFLVAQRAQHAPNPMMRLSQAPHRARKVRSLEQL